MLMARNWKYLYLHTGDVLKLGTKGGVLGRKKSKNKQLIVDDDLPGSTLDFGGKPEDRQIFTLPHGSRAVPFVSKIEEPNYIEGGEKISFSKGLVSIWEELEQGRLIFEAGEYIPLKDLTTKSLKKILSSARKTSVEFWKEAKPSMAGKCGAQYAQALTLWRKSAKVGIRVTTDAPDTFENGNLADALENILRTENPREYITEESIHLLEFIILIEFLDKLWSDESRLDELKNNTLNRFGWLFEQLRSNFGYPSKVILPLRDNDDIHNIAHDLAEFFDLKALHPFIETKNRGYNLDFEDWLSVLEMLKQFFPTMSHLSWMETQEGNDASMTEGMNMAGLGNVVIDFLTVIIKYFDIPNTRPNPSVYRNLGIQIRKSATFHHGHRVVCDRKIQSNPQVNALMELYDDKCRIIGGRFEVGNNPKLTHKPDDVNYDEAAWLVLRIGETASKRPLQPRMFHSEFHDEYRANNPWEAFVTLPWFIQYDESRQSKAVGFLDHCSNQLVHVHFLNRLDDEPQSFVIIPVKHLNSDRLKVEPKRGPLESFTTVCFRSMYSKRPDGEHHEEHESINPNRRETIAAIPGMKWWIERPSTLY